MSFSKRQVAALVAGALLVLSASAAEQVIPENQAALDIIRASQEGMAKWQAEKIAQPQSSPAASVTAAKSTVPFDPLPGVIPTQKSKKRQTKVEDELNTTYYFVSFAMPQAMLADTIRSLGKNEVAVFRGPVAGETMRDFLQRLYQLLGRPKDEKEASIALQVDPTRFRKCGIRAVPATCIITPGGPVAAHGILSGEYLKRNGVKSDRALGQTWEIAEIDLAEELKKRIMGITKEDLRRETIKSVFLDRKYVKLPRARATAAFQFDPSVIRNSNMVVNNTVVAFKGERINPIARGLSHSYVVFDATDTRQIDIALRLVPMLRDQGKSVRVIVSDFPSHKDGFSVIEDLSRKLGGRVTILDEALATSLRLRALPSVVESTTGGMLLINEVASL